MTEKSVFLALDEVPELSGLSGSYGNLIFDVQRDVGVIASRSYGNSFITVRKMAESTNADSLFHVRVSVGDWSEDRVYYSDITRALRIAFIDIFERASGAVYTGIRGSFEPWLFEGGDTRDSIIGLFRVARYGGEVREWKGRLGSAEVVIIEGYRDVCTAFIPICHTPLLKLPPVRSSYRGEAAIAIMRPSFEEVIQALVGFRDNIRDIYDFLSRIRDPIGIVPWTQKIQEDIF